MHSTRACISQKAGRDSRASSRKTNDAHGMRYVTDIMFLQVSDHGMVLCFKSHVRFPYSEQSCNTNTDHHCKTDSPGLFVSTGPALH